MLIANGMKTPSWAKDEARGPSYAQTLMNTLLKRKAAKDIWDNKKKWVSKKDFR